MKVYILIWVDGGYFTIKLTDGRELILAFNDGKKAAAFMSGVKLGGDRMLATVEIPVKGDVKEVLQKMVPSASEELEHIEIIYPSDPLFTIIIEAILED